MNQVEEDVLREFLAVALMMGGSFNENASEPLDPVDEWLRANVYPDGVFDMAEGRGYLHHTEAFNEDGEDDGTYEVTEAGKAFVEGSQ